MEVGGWPCEKRAHGLETLDKVLLTLSSVNLVHGKDIEDA